MSTFEELCRKLTYFNAKSIESVKRAYLIASKAHKGQKRSNGKPYISHPVAVAHILANLKLDPDTITACLLHDTLEDTPIIKNDIQSVFGLSVANLVDGVTKLAQIKFDNTAEAQAENFRKMVMAMAKDMRVIIIKLADRLHNMRTLASLPAHKRQRIARETLEIFAPVARRLGMREFYIELEDLAFATIYPWRYKVLKRSLEKTRKEREKTLSRINKTLKSGLQQYHIPFRQITGREKHLYSIYRKIKVRRVSIHEIMDVYAFRILVDDIDTCYRALGGVHRLYKPVPGRFKDYIAIPKANGYQSLHTILFGTKGVPLEVQIRTLEMDKTATSGIAAHWVYKSQSRPFDTQDLAKQWINHLLELQSNTNNSLEFIENVKVDLFPDEVYVFTPKGEIMSLPGGATAVDFAYAVHTEIGHTCVAVKIDRQLAPLSSILSNGQTVEIITAKEGRPTPTWLNFVVTSKARSNIRQFLKNQRRIQSVKLGKQLFKKALSQYRLSLQTVPKPALQQLITQLDDTQCKTLDDLFAEIGIGNRAAPLVIYQLILVMQKLDHTRGKKLAMTEYPLMINGTEGMLVKFSQCCYPIPGDPIVGIIQAGKGIHVHRENCPTIHKFRRYPNKYILLSWADKIMNVFTTTVQVEALNRPESIAAISSIFAKENGHIENLTVKIKDSVHQLLIIYATVRGRKHLAKIISELKKVPFIQRIIRMKPKTL
jgi:guanosine-3',5'-bis(diphosphate) 3'-pyrophosphohydrolase